MESSLENVVFDLIWTLKKGKISKGRARETPVGSRSGFWPLLLSLRDNSRTPESSAGS